MAICAHCGEQYTQKVTEKYCSTECRGAKKSKKVTCQCLSCGEPFKVPPSHAKLGAGKYCSAKCKYAHFGLARRTRITKVCPICETAFETTPSATSTCCSYACMGVLKQRKEDRECVTCGDVFRIKRTAHDICCSWECRVERLRGENHPSWKGGGLGYHYVGNWIRQRRKARKRDGNCCVECSKTAEENGQNMSVHHTKPYRSFLDPEDANQLENLVSLCRNCHATKPE